LYIIVGQRSKILISKEETQMNFQNNFQQPPMIQYASMRQPLMTQPVDNEKRKLLAHNGGQFTTELTAEQVVRATCTHKDGNRIALINNGNGTLTCPICQVTFDDEDLDQENVVKATNKIKSIIEMIKTCYVDIPVKTAEDFYPITALLDKIPELARIAVNNFAQYENQNKTQQQYLPYGVQAVQGMMGMAPYAGGMGYGYANPNFSTMYQQQAYNTQQIPAYQPMGQPVQAPYQQPPMGQPMYQQPQQVSYSPVGGYQTTPGPVAPPQVNVTPGFMPVNEFGQYGAAQPGMGQQVQTAGQPVYQPAQPQTPNQPAPAPQAQQSAQATVPVQPQAPNIDVNAFNM
jgi:uncharacterized Zn finger protein (UPF0148 family)